MKPYALLIPASLLWATTSRADSELDALLSEDVITTASRNAESSRTAPGLSTSITAEQLRIYGLRTVAEAIDFLALGISSSGQNQHGDQVELGSRGVLLAHDTGNHFLLTINGHAINEVGLGTARFDRGAGIPLELVDHIEVTVGPGSVLYGNNAMFGVINVLLKRGDEMNGAYAVLDGSTLKSYRAGAGAGYQFDLFCESGQAVLGLEYYDRQGPGFDVGLQNVELNIGGTVARTTSDDSQPGIWGGTLDNSNYSRIPAAVFSVQLGEWQLRGQAKYSAIGDPLGQDFFDEKDSRTIDKSLWFDLSHNWVLPAGVEFKTRAYVDGYSHRQYIMKDSTRCGPQQLTTCLTDKLRVSRWAGLELRSSIDWFEDQEWQTSFGVDNRIRYVGARTDRSNASTGQLYTTSIDHLDTTDVAFGAYIQQVWNPTRNVGVNVGARVDEDQRFDPVLSPRAAVSVGLWEGGVAKIMYAKAFRAPGRFATDAVVQFQLPPIDLQPETVHSAEVVVEHTYGTHRGTVGAFSTLWQDMIELHILSLEERYAEYGEDMDQFIQYEYVRLQNVAELTSYGINGAYRTSLLDDRLNGGFTATYAFSREHREDGHREVVIAPALTANARAAYTHAKDWPTLGVAAAYIGERLADRAFNNDFVPQPKADAQLDIRTTLSGSVYGMAYRLTANYAITDHGAKVIGPVQRGHDENPSAELFPVKQFTGYGELSYEF